mmetsp:Transcript_23858/g.28833  ORF Transcript_23858/g.28833 Transcript_23858/m.28833 type:complete len:227 (+) Transcript_23858:1553-2233(+)
MCLRRGRCFIAQLSSLVPGICSLVMKAQGRVGTVRVALREQRVRINCWIRALITSCLIIHSTRSFTGSLGWVVEHPYKGYGVVFCDVILDILFREVQGNSNESHHSVPKLLHFGSVSLQHSAHLWESFIRKEVLAPGGKLGQAVRVIYLMLFPKIQPFLEVFNLAAHTALSSNRHIAPPARASLLDVVQLLFSCRQPKEFVPVFFHCLAQLERHPVSGAYESSPSA